MFLFLSKKHKVQATWGLAVIFFFTVCKVCLHLICHFFFGEVSATCLEGIRNQTQRFPFLKAVKTTEFAIITEDGKMGRHVRTGAILKL